MSFIALVIALLIEQVRPLPEGNGLHKSLAQWHLWVQHVKHASDQKGAWLIWGLAVALPSFLVLVIYLFLLYVFGWFWRWSGLVRCYMRA